MKAKCKFIFPLLALFYLSACTKEDKGACPLTVDIKVVDLNDSTKKLVAVAAGGIEPYDYTWDKVNSDVEITIRRNGTGSLAPGPHNIIVEDASGCIARDSVFISFVCGLHPTVTDFDGNTYEVVRIGNQCWTKSNLIVSNFIPEVTDSATWKNTTSPAWCYYDNNPANAALGKLYNWYAVSQIALCPAGWHIPTEADWQQLTTFLGNENAGKMKSTTGWDSPNTGATNSSGFSAVGSGYRSFISSRFYGLKQSTGYWTSTQTTDSTAYSRGLNYDSPWLTSLPVRKSQGYSCRCVMD